MTEAIAFLVILLWLPSGNPDAGAAPQSIRRAHRRGFLGPPLGQFLTTNAAISETNIASQQGRC